MTGSGQCRRLKEEDIEASPPLPPVKKLWWEKEEEFPGLNFMVGRSVDEDYRKMTVDPRQAAAWSARDHGANFVDLAGPSVQPAPKEEEEDDADWSFGTSNDGGDDGNNLDFSAFDARATFV
jgi:hypothetical protein